MTSTSLLLLLAAIAAEPADRPAPHRSVRGAPSTASRPRFPRAGMLRYTNKKIASSWRLFPRKIWTVPAWPPVNWHWHQKLSMTTVHGSTPAPKKANPDHGTLASNRVIKDARGERLETVWEFNPPAGGFWREVKVRTIANRQLYTFILNVEDSVYARVRPAFDTLVAATHFSPPNTGADLLAKSSNQWIQREYKFALDLPEGWAPVLAPSEVALLFANGPPHGVWSDNLLVVAYPHQRPRSA